MTSISYKQAGVDIAAGNEVVARIKQAVQATFNSAVLTELGSFAALYDIKPLLAEYSHPVLVQSIDGVGTKMLIAKAMQKFDTIGIDLVSATTNDIIVLGAKPLTLLDYIANEKLAPAQIEQIIKGIAGACVQHNIALVGGETAEMPGTYLSGEYDLVGSITGVVEKDHVILGKNIVAGDSVVALPASGLHTNGYSLARKLLFETAGYTLHTQFPELNNQVLGLELLTPHYNYTRPVLAALAAKVQIHGMAHISGGGVIENIPRILPANLAVELHKSAAPKLPIFGLLQQLGQLDDYEAYRTFNMGMGLIIILPTDQIAKLRAAVQEFPEYPVYEVGTVIVGNSEVKLLA